MIDFEEQYKSVLHLVVSALASEDDAEKELMEDMVKSAFKYTEHRLNSNFYSLEQKLEQDKYRTSAHNRYMDALNIFLRYEKSLGKEIPDITGYDRKMIGDIANRLVSDLAIRQR